MPAPNEITPTQLMRLLGTNNAPALYDVCIDDDFAQDPRLIPTAQRHPHTDLATLGAQIGAHIGAQPVVIVCQKGKKLSQGVAAYLRTQGITAEYLQGGNYAWRDAGLPLVPAAKIPAQVNGATLWVTRHRPKIDRIACPWLIRRFIDPKARFLYVAPDSVTDVAEKFGATPFDIEGCDWGHVGALCTFDAMLAGFSLGTKPLLHLAKVIRAADTNDHGLAPESAGLLAFSVGLSRAYKDDLMQLEAGLPLYDALYRWARDGVNEGHDATRETAP